MFYDKLTRACNLNTWYQATTFATWYQVTVFATYYVPKIVIILIRVLILLGFRVFNNFPEYCHQHIAWTNIKYKLDSNSNTNKFKKHKHQSKFHTDSVILPSSIHKRKQLQIQYYTKSKAWTWSFILISAHLYS